MTVRSIPTRAAHVQVGDRVSFRQTTRSVRGTLDSIPRDVVVTDITEDGELRMLHGQGKRFGLRPDEPVTVVIDHRCVKCHGTGYEQARDDAERCPECFGAGVRLPEEVRSYIRTLEDRCVQLHREVEAMEDDLLDVIDEQEHAEDVPVRPGVLS